MQISDVESSDRKVAASSGTPSAWCQDNYKTQQIQSLCWESPGICCQHGISWVSSLRRLILTW